MSTLESTDQRILIKASLEPIGASTFQPTGFPNLGAAEFKRPVDGGGPDVDCLLVESVQSMTNHLEGLGWDSVASKPVPLLKGLPYVEIIDGGGRHLASSRQEPHRLASAYVRDADIDGQPGVEWISEQLGLAERRPTDWPKIHKAVFGMDPMCLIHGVFFSDPKWKNSGNPKIRRAITAVIEAHNVRRVISGGVKRDDVQFTSAQDAGAKEGYGFVPFGRTEYTAQEILLTAAIDIGQIRGYGLADQETELLLDLAQWEVARLISDPLRLRTACDLEIVGAPDVSKPSGYELPEVEELEARISSAIQELGPVEPTSGTLEPK